MQRTALIGQRYSHYPVCDGGVDRVIGMVRVKDLLAQLLEGQPLDLESALREPLFVPEGQPALSLLEVFRETGVHLALVIDEYGGVEGLITLTDILEQIAGSIEDDDDDQSVVQREDGSWLVDASLTIDDFRDAVGLDALRGTGPDHYRTLGGMVVTELGRIPRTGEVFHAFGRRFEVVDMDRHRVDKVLVSGARAADELTADPEQGEAP